jgi:hypothetical protein
VAPHVSERMRRANFPRNSSPGAPRVDALISYCSCVRSLRTTVIGNSSVQPLVAEKEISLGPVLRLGHDRCVKVSALGQPWLQAL